MFKKHRSIQLPYRVQGLIYFTALTYSMQPPHIKEAIDKLIEDVTRDNYSKKALKELLTTDTKTATRIANDNYCRLGTLYEWQKEFYLNASKYGIVPKQL